MTLVIVPMIYRAFGWFAIYAPTRQLMDLGYKLEHIFLLLVGGLESPYFFGFYLRPEIRVPILVAAGAALAWRLGKALLSRSLVPPAAFRDMNVLLAGFGLAFWLFNALAVLGVPLFWHYSLVLWPLANADRIAAGFLMAWFWLTELRAIWMVARARIVNARG